jgi:acylphosphatase
MAQKNMRAVVSGRVQGVCFRASTREAALRYGVKGWVRNLPDGSVEAMVSGEADRVERMIAWLHQGPPSSRVSRVTLEEIEPDEQFAAFEIRYW